MTKMDDIRAFVKSEKEKIKNIPGFKAKLTYIWEYYWIPIVALCSLIIFLIFAVYQYTTSLKECWFYITFANTNAEIGNESELWQGYVDYTGFDTTKKKVEFNNAAYFDYTKGVTGNSYFEQFVAYEEGGTLDAVTMEADSLIGLGESGRLLDLNSEEAASVKEKYGDRFVYCEPYDKDYSSNQVPIGIDISDSVLMTKYNIYPETCVLGIGANTHNIEAVEQFLDYIYMEN